MSNFKKHKQVFITLLLLIMLIGGGHLPRPIESNVFYFVVFGVALLAYVKNRYLNLVLACSTVFYVSAWYNSFHDVLFNILFCVSGILCLFSSVTSTIHTMLRSKTISMSDIFALVNCYLIVGYAWALIYTLVDGFSPNAFNMAVRNERIMDSYIYFSFTTMTTVGFGDVLPRSVLAQRLSVTQAIFGQFYFALVVAYLLNKLFHHRVELSAKEEMQK